MRFKHLAFVITFVVLGLCTLLFKLLDTPLGTVNVYLDVETDNLLSMKLNEASLSDYKVNLQKEINKDTEAIITDDKEVIKKYSEDPEYVVLENYYSSPIVMLMDDSINDSSTIDKYNLYLSRIYDNSNAKYFLNTKRLFEDSLNGKTFEDVGFEKDIGKGPIRFVIPDDSNSYHKDVVKFIYMVFNDCKPLTVERAQELKPTVDKFLSKCIQTPNIHTYAGNSDREHKLIILPEFMIANIEHNSADFRVVNHKSTVNMYYSLILRKDEKNTETGINEELKRILSNKKFIKKTSLRVRDYEDRFDKATRIYLNFTLLNNLDIIDFDYSVIDYKNEIPQEIEPTIVVEEKSKVEVEVEVEKETIE